VAVAASIGILVLFQRTDGWHAAARWPLILAAGAVAAALVALTDMLLTAWIAKSFSPHWLEWALLTGKRYRSLYIFYVWPFAANVALLWALSANDRARQLERRAAEAEAARQHAYLDALRLQLNPHFLFNTLNTISALVAQGEGAEARAMLARLSDFLRASLATDAASLITLGDELDIVQAYLEIEGVRFEDRLILQVDCGAGVREALVPGFLLQPLVENAMKYAVGPALRPVVLSLQARLEGNDLVVSVEDDGESAASPVHSAGGYGLANVRARLAALYGEKARLEAAPLDPGFRACIRMPLMRSAKEISEQDLAMGRTLH
jgi:two-component system LytT family sensor kinase